MPPATAESGWPKFLGMHAKRWWTYVSGLGRILVIGLLVEWVGYGQTGLGDSGGRALPAATTPAHPYRVGASPVGTGALPDATVQVQLADGVARVETNTIRVSFNGTPVGAAVTASNGVTTISFKPGAPFTDADGLLAPGSSNTVAVVFRDTSTPAYTNTISFSFAVVPAYTRLPETAALPPGAVNTNISGFLIRTYQVDALQPNGIANAEALLAGEHGPNVADLTFAGADGYFVWPNVINFDIASGHGHFTAANGYPDFPFPGIPGQTLVNSPTENFACELLTAIAFPAAGAYVLGIDSDDDFRTSAGLNPEDALERFTVGEFDAPGGRGWADTTFVVVVTKPGLYPFRTVYEQGQGDASLEWWSVHEGADVLLNDPTAPGALLTYAWQPTGPYVAAAYPGPGHVSLVGVPTLVSFTVVDGPRTQFDPNSARLEVNGQSVPVTVSSPGPGTNLLSYAPGPSIPANATNTLRLVFADTGTPPTLESNQWTFVTGAPLPADVFTIEAEDFDSQGLSQDQASVMPYYGGAYAGLGATYLVDYFNNDAANTSPRYRDYTTSDLSGAASVGIGDNTAGRLGQDRGGWDMRLNYYIGWVDNGEWYDYTRTIPPGIYTAYAAHSDGTAGTTIGGWLGLVTAGAGTTNQTVQPLGALLGPAGPGGWGSNTLLPMTTNGQPVYFRLPGGRTTLRYTTYAGDFDWFALVPARTNSLLLQGITAAPFGFTATLWDGPASVADTNTITLTIRGFLVSPTRVIHDTNGTTTIAFITTTPLTSGGAYPVGLTIKDQNGTSFSWTQTLTVPTFTKLDAGLALPAGAVATNAPGFLIKTYQVAATQPNSLTNAEAMLRGQLGPNTANLSNTVATGPDTGLFAWTNVINFDLDPTATDGHFNAPSYPDSPFPGIPGHLGSPGNTENFALDLWTAIAFPAPGAYTMVVNSDDGFGTSLLNNPKDLFYQLGQFDGGRTAADTTFTLVVLNPGLYGFRTLYEQGQGFASLEWMTQTADGRYHLLNDPTDPAALRAYQWRGRGQPPYVLRVAPLRNSVGLGDFGQGPLTARIADGDTPLDPASLRLVVNGHNLSPTISKTNGVSTVQALFAPPLPVNTNIAVTLTFADQVPAGLTPYTETVQWEFQTGHQLPDTGFVIEAEDFDYGTNQTLTAASQMPYFGGAYAGLGARYGIDYQNNDHFESLAYRDYSTNSDRLNGLAVGGQSVNLTDNAGGRYGLDRGGWLMAVDYRIGWVDDGEWYDYTRTIPAGTYQAYAALSSGDTLAHSLRGRLELVTAGVGTTNQTLRALGAFDAPGSGAWGDNHLAPLVATNNLSGPPTTFTLPGGPVTLRFTTGSGDFDWFILVPNSVTPIEPPLLVSITADKAGLLTLIWTGGGTLQASPDLKTWTDVPGSTPSPAILPANQARQFYRVKRNP